MLLPLESLPELDPELLLFFIRRDSFRISNCTKSCTFALLPAATPLGKPPLGIWDEGGEAVYGEPRGAGKSWSPERKIIVFDEKKVVKMVIPPPQGVGALA